MKILENIQLRSVAGSLETLSEQIATSIQSEGETSSVVAIYRRNGLETDLAIHIHRNGTTGTVGPSKIGLRLASELRAYGLVDHSLWERVI